MAAAVVVPALPQPLAQPRFRPRLSALQAARQVRQRIAALDGAGERAESPLRELIHAQLAALPMLARSAFKDYLDGYFEAAISLAPGDDTVLTRLRAFTREARVDSRLTGVDSGWQGFCLLMDSAHRYRNRHSPATITPVDRAALQRLADQIASELGFEERCKFERLSAAAWAAPWALRRPSLAERAVHQEQGLAGLHRAG